jgi:dTDP-glucose 4,6-dehydratase
LVTGGAGFIGRWVVKKFLENGHSVFVIDNLRVGHKKNLEEFESNPKFKVVYGDVLDKELLKKIFENKFDICIHAAAQIHVQDSIDDPLTNFDININGTINVLDLCRRDNTKFVSVGTCMVYDTANSEKNIDENHPVKPACPYAASKLAGEYIALSYYLTYGLPVVLLRPINTYGPFQFYEGLEGGVIIRFLRRKLLGTNLLVYGDGKQERDFIYIKDCVDFIYEASMSEKAVGELINAGSGKGIAIKDLAKLVVKDENRIEFVKHPHPQSEIKRLVFDSSKAEKLLGWKPKYSLEQGIEETEKWVKMSLS